MNKQPNATVYFADAWMERNDYDRSLPAKFQRMLKRALAPERVKDKAVCIKMHLGGGLGYTTIHPVFVRMLVEHLKACGAKSMKVIDGNAADGIARGYTREVLGCPVVSSFGEGGRYYVREPIGFHTLDEVFFSGEALDSDFFLDFSHVKGHGACGFGGAIKNIAMGVTPWQESRGKLHALEGGLAYDETKCTFCKRCIKVCRYGAITANAEKKRMDFFLHHCTFCQHCLMECPRKAITMNERDFTRFSEGMAIVTTAFLRKFKKENTFFINLLNNITMFCDCWGFSSPSLVPDIGVLASDEIAAIEAASLDLIKEENLLRTGLPKGFTLQERGNHLFEKIHGKDPWPMVRFVSQYYGSPMAYDLVEIK